MKHNLRSLHTNRASPSPYWRYPFAADDEVGSPLVPWTSGGTSKGRSAKADGERYVTDEQRSCRPIFNATLRAAASWLTSATLFSYDIFITKIPSAKVKVVLRLEGFFGDPDSGDGPGPPAVKCQMGDGFDELGLRDAAL
jgi:hypothetical protein